MKQELTNEWVEWLQNVRRVRGATLDAYSRTINYFNEYITAEYEWVTADDVERFMGRPRKGGIIGSPATQDRERVIITQFYKWLNSRDITSNNPCFNVGVPKVRNRQPRAVTDDVWVQLWSSDLHREDRVWLGLAGFAGLRRRELVSVWPEAFDLDKETINHMQRKGGGTASVEYGEMARTIGQFLPHLLPNPEGWIADVAWLAKYRIAQGGRTLIPFGSPATTITRLRMSLDDPWVSDPAVINKRLESVLKAAGLNPRRFSPHALRHTCATNMMRCGVPLEIAADQLAHASIETTRRYLHTAGALGQWRKTTR
jgi:integrase/recombinase XerD